MFLMDESMSIIEISKLETIIFKLMHHLPLTNSEEKRVEKILICKDE